MNLIETLLNGAGRSAVSELARNFDLNSDQTSEVVKKLAPALARGLAKNTQDASGLDGLLNALKNGNHERYLDDPSTITSDSGIADGNGILGHLFGNKDVSREVARRTAQETGISDSLIKKMLPMVAGLVMGSLSKQQRTQPDFAETLGKAAQSGQTSQAGGLLNSFLDADKDGSVVDDLIGMAGRFLGR